jgi:hypothetical protein
VNLGVIHFEYKTHYFLIGFYITPKFTFWSENIRLGPKSLHGNRFYKGHCGKSLTSGVDWDQKAPATFHIKKSKRPPKFLLKFPFSIFCIRNWKGHCDQRRIATMTNTHLPHITLKILYSTKNVFKKPRNLWKSLNLSEKVFKNNWNLYKSPTFLNRRLNFSRNVFQMPRFVYKILTFLNESLHFFETVFTVLKKPQFH